MKDLHLGFHPTTEITQELNQAIDDKKLLEKMRKDAKTESVRKDINKGNTQEQVQLDTH